MKMFTNYFINIEFSVMLRLGRQFRKIFTRNLVWKSFSEEKQPSFWKIVRPRNQNHGIAHMRRKHPKDRYSIHKITNISFLCSLVSNQAKYQLSLNQKIMLLAQLQHLFKLLHLNRNNYLEVYLLICAILKGVQDPPDLPCLGTFMITLISMENYSQNLFQQMMDCLLKRKYDQDYDELFGIIYGLYSYKSFLHSTADYSTLTNNKVLPYISVIYRNSLKILMEYIKYNIYNQKECQIIVRALYSQKINEGYFWESIRDWFNIHIKEQVRQKPFEDYFIIKQQNIEKMLYDNGMIRPRPLIGELGEIAYVLIQNNIFPKRFIPLFEDIVQYTMVNGKKIFEKFLEMQKNYQNKKAQVNINEHIHLKTPEQQQRLRKMQQSYKLLFINPIDINDGQIIRIMLVMVKTRQYQKQKLKSENLQNPNKQHNSNQNSPQKQNQNVLKWLWIRLCRSQMRYNISQLLQIVIFAGSLFSLNSYQVQQLFIQRLKNNLRQLDCSLIDLKRLLLYLPMIEFDILGKVLQNFLLKSHPKDILLLTEFIQKQFWIKFLTDYFLKLPKAVNNHEKYYSFEENCYFLYILLKNQVYWQSKIDNQYSGQKEILKQSIKITIYTRGFKLQIDSYLHKMLDYVDIAQFFQGGKS